MRKTIPIKIGDLWDDFLKSSPGVARKLAEAKAVESWAVVVGPAVAASTIGISLDKGVLNVKFDSSVVRSEIFMRRDALRDAINKEVGANVVRTVIVK